MVFIRICNAVSEYYEKQFLLRWKEKTRGCHKKNQDSNIISVVAALLLEKNGNLNVVLLTAGTKIKHKCSFVQGNIEESTWGLCDGHAEAVCYRLAYVYFMTEIYKIDKKVESIFEETKDGYRLKDGIEFHLFTSHPPCGFMAKKERYYLSWKRPFTTMPHNPQCSSKILINSYLGIQGPLSLLLVKPIYISSLVILKYESTVTLHDDYIEKRLEEFQRKLSEVSGSSTGSYSFCKPDVCVVDIHPNEMFLKSFTPYIQEKRNKPSCEGVLPHQEGTVRQQTKPHTTKIGSSWPDVVGDAGIETLVFSITDPGIGSKEEREKINKLKAKSCQLRSSLKQQRLKFLQEARIKLSKAINVGEALRIQYQQIAEQMEESYTKRCDTIKETVSVLESLSARKADIDELTAQVSDSKNFLDKIRNSSIPSLQTAMSHNLSYEQMLQDLKS